MCEEHSFSARIINGKTELSIRAETRGALLPWAANSFPMNSNFINVGEEIYAEREEFNQASDLRKICQRCFSHYRRACWGIYKGEGGKGNHITSN